MPIKIIEIPDVNNTIQKNIHDSVTRNLLRYLGLENGDIIYDTATNREVAQPDSTVGEQRGLSYGNTDKVVVEYDETRDEMNRIERAPFSHNELPIFVDHQHGIAMTPSDVRYDVTVTIRRRAPSRAIISNWCNAIQRILDQDRAVMLTQADFHYVIPTMCLNLIADCYRTKELNIPTDQSLADYMKEHFSPATTTIANLAGKEIEFAMRQTITRIVGTITGDGPQQTKDDNLVSWVGEYQYRFSYTRPESIVMRYPIVLNNTMLSEIWWVDNAQPGLSDEFGAAKPILVAAGDYITRYQYITLPIHIPQSEYPDLPLPIVGGYIHVVIGQLVFGKDDIKKPAYLFDLDKIPGMEFDEATLKYLHDAFCRDGQGKCSTVKIIVYEDGIPLSDVAVGVDCSDMSVWMDYLPDITKNYQFSIAVQTDWTILSDCQYDELRKHPGYVDSFIDTFFPHLRPEFSHVNGDTYPTGKLDKIIEQMGSGGGANGAHPNTGAWGSTLRIPITVVHGKLFTYTEF